MRLGDLATVIGARPERHHGPGVERAASGIALQVLVTDVEHDSRRVRPGALFACIAGHSFDGHDHAAEAVNAGAVAVLADRDLRRGLPVPVPVLRVDSVREALGPAAAAVWGHPGENLTLVGVTGTNGKTTTVRLMASLLERCVGPVTEIGTLTGSLTTPEATDLQRTLASAVSQGHVAAVMEVSSHALCQHRTDGTTFHAAVFTGLGHDHLDYHGTTEAYYRAKARLFEPSRTRRAVINTAASHGERLADEVRAEGSVDVIEVNTDTVQVLALESGQSRFAWRDQVVTLPLGGRFNITNAVLAAETLLALELISAGHAAEALGECAPVPGRFELVDEGQDFTVLVDYSHSPDGIIAALEAARETTEGKLTVVFGAGGGRDQSKRPLMGRAAETHADRVVITSDNPRHEDLKQIMNEIAAGMTRPPDLMQPDRRLAIRHAFERARAGDTVVLAGKGHETTQTSGATVTGFDDRQVARSELARLAGGGGAGSPGASAAKGGSR